MYRKSDFMSMKIQHIVSFLLIAMAVACRNGKQTETYPVFPEEPSRTAYEGFTWEKISGAGIQLWAQRNPNIHIVLDEGSIKGQENICRLGSGKITVKNLTKGTVSTFMIVGSSEASPLEGKISNSCPVALAILGHRVGDIVEVKAKIPYQLVIEKIEN